MHYLVYLQLESVLQWELGPTINRGMITLQRFIKQPFFKKQIFLAYTLVYESVAIYQCILTYKSALKLILDEMYIFCLTGTGILS